MCLETSVGFDIVCLKFPVLTEIDRLSQKSKHEGVHKGDDDYKRRMDTVVKKWMPISVSLNRYLSAVQTHDTFHHLYRLCTLKG